MDTYEATFGIGWQLQQCIEAELDGTSGLGSAFTISGDSSHSWAASCCEYVEEQWSDLGMDFLKKIELILIKVSGAEASCQCP
jgi:hypothetical protein